MKFSSVLIEVMGHVTKLSISEPPDIWYATVVTACCMSVNITCIFTSITLKVLDIDH